MPQPDEDVQYDEDLYGDDPFDSVPGEGTPRIVITVPSVEAFGTVVGLLQQAGARICERRSFAVEGPLTLQQAVALLRLADFQDAGDGGRLGFRVENVPSDRAMPTHAWWAKQQAMLRS